MWFAPFDVAVDMVRSCGAGGMMGKYDTESYCRLLPVHREDFDLLGVQFQGQFYFDKALPMGCLMTCMGFKHFSTVPEWAFKGESMIS